MRNGWAKGGSDVGPSVTLTPGEWDDFHEFTATVKYMDGKAQTLLTFQRDKQNSHPFMERVCLLALLA